MKNSATPDAHSPTEKGCFCGALARIDFWDEDLMTSPGVLKMAPAFRV